MPRNNRKQVKKQSNNHKLNKYRGKNDKKVYNLIDGMSGRVSQRHLKIK